jgi:hypothetical protein
MQGIEPREEDTDFPTVADGLRGMKFLETVIASGKSEQKWTDFIR